MCTYHCLVILPPIGQYVIADVHGRVYDAHGPSFSLKGPPRPCSIFLRRWPAFRSGVDLWTLLVAGFERGIGARRQSIMLSGGQLFGGGRGDGGVVVAEMSRTSIARPPPVATGREVAKDPGALSPSTQENDLTRTAHREGGGREGRGDEREKAKKNTDLESDQPVVARSRKKEHVPRQDRLCGGEVPVQR